MRLLYQGLLRSPASWARVGRGYLKAFARLGLEVAAIAPRGFRHDPAWPLPAGVAELRPVEARAGPQWDLGVGFLHPPLLGRMLGRRKACLFVWEADRIPPGWVAPLSTLSDLVAVPSGFTAEALERSGVPRERIAIAPYGYDEEHLEQARASSPVEASRPFTFLAVMTPHWRKGPRELLAAYRRAFSRRDDVLLRICSTYDPSGGPRPRPRPFEIPSWPGLVRDCGLEDPEAPPVALEVRTTGDEATFAPHAAADVVVAPSWGESFGLAVLEGLAAGLPVVATGWGGHTGLIGSSEDLIPFRLVSVPGALYEPVEGARVALPDVELLAARLRWHREHPAASRRLGAAGEERVRGLTWMAAARSLLAAVTSAGDRTA